MKNRMEIIIFFIFLSIFTITALIISNPGFMPEYEVKIIHFVQHMLKFVPVSVPVFMTDSWYGQITLIVLLFAVIFLINKKYKDAIIIILALPAAKYIYGVLKMLIERPRPPLESRLVEVSSFSFPSGHSTMSMVLFGLLIYFAYKFINNKVLKTVIIVSLALFILLIGFTRIWLGVHYPTDIIGGYSLGICFICFCIFIDKLKISKSK